MVEKTPLEDWIRGNIVPQSGTLNRRHVENYQLKKLKENIDYAKNNCIFYNRLLADINSSDIKSLEDIRKIPFTLADDLRELNNQMLCVSQNEISRIVTLDTSGTTGKPKRIYFTKEDQQLTIDFFRIGMSTFTKPGDKVLVLLPGRRPGSIGDLLKIALNQMGVETIVYGVVDDAEKVGQIILEEAVNGIVGIPQQVLALVQLRNAHEIKAQGQLKNILLSTDYVSESLRKQIIDKWNCRVYDHYGMTEMGLGGGVFCQKRNGYHLREADLLFEIVDPITEKPVKEGELGEVVFTTLTRKGMPLIRYKTGDISRFLPYACECGTVLRTMDKIQYRMASAVALSNGYLLTMADLEEILFEIEGVIDFDASIESKDCTDYLIIHVHQKKVRKALNSEIEKAMKTSKLHPLLLRGIIKIEVKEQIDSKLDIKAIKKRKILDKRGREENG